MSKKNKFQKTVFLTMILFLFSSLQTGRAQTHMAVSTVSMPASDCMPRGLKIYPQDPLRFDFLISSSFEEADTQVMKKMVHYFLTALTIPKENLWVNLSPYEKDRIIPFALGETEMGEDLLLQDYVLKQVTSSLMDPQHDIGQIFWQKVYAKAQEEYGTIDIPIDAFNKVWIVPDKAIIDENTQSHTAYIVESKLKVMLEADYLAQSKGLLLNPEDVRKDVGGDDAQTITKAILQEVIIPILEKEVNEGSSFTAMRQIYQALILAFWYKKNIFDHFLAQNYIDQEKIEGLFHFQQGRMHEIWEQYVEVFAKGAFHRIQEEKDVLSQDMIPIKYFSGGAKLDLDSQNVEIRTNKRPNALSMDPAEKLHVIQIKVEPFFGGKQEQTDPKNFRGLASVVGFSSSLKTKKDFLAWMRELGQRKKASQDIASLFRLEERLQNIGTFMISLMEQPWYIQKVDQWVETVSAPYRRQTPIPMAKHVPYYLFWETLKKEYQYFFSQTNQKALLEIPDIVKKFIEKNQYQRLDFEMATSLLDHLKLYYIYHSHKTPYSLIFLKPEHVFFREFEDSMGNKIAKVIFLSKSVKQSSLIDINEFFFVDGVYYGYGHMKVSSFERDAPKIDHVKMLFHVLEHQRGRVKGLSKFVFQDREKEVQKIFMDQPSTLLIEPHQFQSLSTLFFYLDQGFSPVFHQSLLEELKKIYFAQQEMKKNGILVPKEEDIELSMDSILKAEGRLGRRYSPLFKTSLRKEISGGETSLGVESDSTKISLSSDPLHKGGIDLQSIEEDIVVLTHSDKEKKHLFETIDFGSIEAFLGMIIHQMQIIPIKSLDSFIN